MKSLEMKNRFEISIGDIEGLEYSNYEYKVILNTMEQYLYETNTFELLGDGNFSFALLSNSCTVGGFTIQIDTLSPGQFWFPIQSPLAELASIPSSSIQGPKIMLTIKQPDLYTVQECSEYSVDSAQQIKLGTIKIIQQELSNKDEIIKKLESLIEKTQSENARLQHIVDELAENFYKFQAENKERAEEYLNENFELQAKMVKVEGEKLKMAEEILALRRQIELLEHRASFKLNEKPEMTDFENFQVKLKDSENKRKELQQVLNSSNSRWLDVKVSNNTLLYLEKENKTLISKVKTLTDQLGEVKPFPAEDENFMKYMHSLSSKLSSCKQKNQNYKAHIESIESENSQYKDIIENFRSEMSKQASENSELSEQLKSALSKIPHREEKIDQIDKELKQYFKDKQMKNPFVKISEGVYNYGNKRLCFNLKNGMPVVRVGGGYMFIDEFLRMYHTHCKKKDEFPMRSYSLEGKGGSTSRLKQKMEEDSKLNETDSPASKSKHETKVLKKVPRRVFIP